MFTVGNAHLSLTLGEWMKIRTSLSWKVVIVCWTHGPGNGKPLNYPNSGKWKSSQPRVTRDYSSDQLHVVVMIHCSTRMFGWVVSADGPNKDIACRRFLTKVQECVGPWMHEVTVVKKGWRSRPLFKSYAFMRFLDLMILGEEPV